MIARSVCLGFALLALFAPVLAGDRPVLVRFEGDWSVPVLSDAPRAPDGSEWREFWLDPERDDDGSIVVMPPCAFSPDAVDPSAVGSEFPTAHWFGVDRSGRDLCARWIHSVRTAVTIGLSTTLLAGVFGVLFGVLLGLGPRLLRGLGERVLLVTMAFPVLVGMLALSTVAGPGVFTTILLLAALFWTAFARVVRAELLRQLHSPRIEAARLLGLSKLRILLRHTGPELWQPVRVTAAFVFADAVLLESALSFLGIGPGAESVSFGGMLREGRLAALDGAGPEQWLPPALTLIVLVLGLHGVAQGPRPTGRGPLRSAEVEQ